MPKFTYTVANKEGKKLSGTVEAPSEASARTELNNLGFSVLVIKEITGEEKTEEKVELGAKFVFEAIDKNSKFVTGTIASEDVQQAYKRLHKEYNLTVTAIWAENANAEQIESARKAGTQKLHETLEKELILEVEEATDPEEKAKRELIKAKIESIIQKVGNLLKNYEAHIEADQKAEINKKIDKLLRIKHSTNLDYILKTAEDLLKFIESQEKTLKDKGLHDERIQLKIKTKGLLKELNKTQTPKADSFSDDIISRINKWQQSHPKEKISGFNIFVFKIFSTIKRIFVTPPEIKAIQQEIKTYNGQLIEFIKLYFKEPSKEYKEKVKTSIKTIWQKRKDAKQRLKNLKKSLKEEKREKATEEGLFISFVKELNTLTGWLLAFYVLYYFTSLYLKTKDFGLGELPNFMSVYESQFFKYILAIIFLLHACTALKVNFFRKSIIASLILPVVFVVTSIITLLNF